MVGVGVGGKVEWVQRRLRRVDSGSGGEVGVRWMVRASRA